MIVPAMNPEEMLVDARKDMRALLNRCKEPLRKLRKIHLRSDRRNVYEHMLTWESPRGNNWLVVLAYNKHRPSVYMLVWYYDKKGRIAGLICSASGGAMTICSHVIDRYGERYDPVVDPVQRLKVFFAENPSFSVLLQNEKEVRTDIDREVHIGINNGLGFGVWKANSDIVHMRTFVDRTMLFKEQEGRVDELDVMRMLQNMNPGQITEFSKFADKQIAKYEADKNKAA